MPTYADQVTSPDNATGPPDGLTADTTATSTHKAFVFSRYASALQNFRVDDIFRHITTRSAKDALSHSHADQTHHPMRRGQPVWSENDIVEASQRIGSR